MQGGLEAKSIWFENGEGVQASGDMRLITLNEFHGEYDLDWMLVMDGEKEVARHNLKHVTSIIWK